MANTMLSNNKSSFSKDFKIFEQQIRNSGKTPENILQELIASGKFSKADLDNAVQKAKQVLGI